MIAKKKVKRPLHPENVGCAYIRVSTERQENGLHAQVADITKWAAQKKITLTAFFIDRGESRTLDHGDRPGFMQALACISANQLGVLLASKRDRLGCGAGPVEILTRAVRDAGALVRTADGIDTDTPEGALNATVRDGFSAFEVAMIRSRTKAGLGVKKLRGERVGGVPYGFTILGAYRVDDPAAPKGYRMKGGRMVPSEAEQVILARVRTLREHGHAPYGIAKILAKDGVLSRTGKPFDPTQIRRMSVTTHGV